MSETMSGSKIHKGKIQMFQKKYKLYEVTEDEILYQVINSKILWNKYLSWKRNLQKEEKAAFKRYRFGKKLSQNINSSLRSDKRNDDAINICNALKKAYAPFNMVVYRNLAKDEAKVLEKMELGESIRYKDFKGCHVRKNIVEYMGFLYSASAYVIFLVPKGMEAAYINYWAPQHFFEKELLINCNSDWTIFKKIEIFKKKKCYYLKKA